MPDNLAILADCRAAGSARRQARPVLQRAGSARCRARPVLQRSSRPAHVVLYGEARQCSLPGPRIASVEAVRGMEANPARIGGGNRSLLLRGAQKCCIIYGIIQDVRTRRRGRSRRICRRAVRQERKCTMTLEKNTVKIGLERPVKLLHVTDSHLDFVDERDDERKRALAGRMRSPDARKYLEEQIAYAHENCDLLVHTGDLMDFVSHPNVEAAREIVSDERVFFIAGNHDYSQYVGEAWEDDAYRMNSYMKMGYGLGVPMFFNARQTGGVNVVGIDNSYYRFADWQLWRLKREVEKGLPVVLAFHDPLFEESLYQAHMRRAPNGCTYLVGCDEEHLLPYSEFRAVQQRPDAPTLRMIDYIKSEPQIRAILTGHLHFGFVSNLTDSLPQFVTGGGYTGQAREVTLV